MKYIDKLIKDHPELSACRSGIESAVNAIVEMHQNHGKLLIAGNGGSAADCEHISGELLKGFLLPRKPSKADFIVSAPDFSDELQRGIAAIPLPSLTSLFTAFSNDASPKLAFAQLVFALGNRSDVFLGISTSGNAENVVLAAETAKARGLITVGLTGMDGGRLAEVCDVSIKAPQTETYKIQELHLPIYHAICAQTEEILFGGNNDEN